jgi:hypothetical protein
MLADQLTPPDPTRQDPFRWARSDICAALDSFATQEHSSQRVFAQQQGIPHATFNTWVRAYSPDENDPVDAFFLSSPGDQVLRRILLAAFLTFHQRGACGLRLVGDFLDLSGLNRYVASSRGALHPLALAIESNLAAFAKEEQPLLVQQMKPRSISLILDEHFHTAQVCLVGIEPVSGFILVECYRDRRDAFTWKQAIDEGRAGMPLQIIQVTSDQASALLCCAEKGLHAAHSPDLFHGQHDLIKPILLPLVRPIHQAEKELDKVREQIDELDGPIDEPWTKRELNRAVELVKREMTIEDVLEEAEERKDRAIQQVRGLGDDYHPFDRETGKGVTAEEVGQRLNGHLDQLEEVVQAAGLNAKAGEEVQKSRKWVGILIGCVAWFWSGVQLRIAKLDLTPEQERVVREKVLGGHYWEKAAHRARTAEEKKRLREMASRLKEEAWEEGGELSPLAEEKRKEVEAVAAEIADLFQRSSSCVEGRNGRLSLQQHGHSRVSKGRLKALTVIHNYLIRRDDGTTAAQRFFGQEHKDLFSWLLDRMPDLPRPAKKRSTKPTEGLPKAG